MKYFVLYTLNADDDIKEYYLKGKSMKHMEERIRRYSNGMIVTSKWALCTDNNEFGFLREINQFELSSMNKRDFVVINENKSWDIIDIEAMEGPDDLF